MGRPRRRRADPRQQASEHLILSILLGRSPRRPKQNTQPRPRSHPAVGGFVMQAKGQTMDEHTIYDAEQIGPAPDDTVTQVAEKGDES